MASVAMLTAVSNPKQRSVPLKSLSIVFGTPTTFFLRWIRRRSAQNRPTTGQNAGNGIEVQRPEVVLQNAAPAFQETHKFVVVVEDPFANNRTDHRIQSRAIAPAGENPDFHFPALSTAIFVLYSL